MKKQEIKFAKRASHNYVRSLIFPSFLYRGMVFILLLCCFPAVLYSQVDPGAQLISAPETLRGHKAMSVDVIMTWQGDTRSSLPEREFSSIVEQAIQDAGIQVLSSGSYPILRLQIGNNCCWSYSGSLALYDNWFINLSFVQLVPVAHDGSNKTMEALTWRRTNWNFTAGWIQTNNQMKNSTRSLLGVFLEEYQSVNR